MKIIQDGERVELEVGEFESAYELGLNDLTTQKLVKITKKTGWFKKEIEEVDALGGPKFGLAFILPCAATIARNGDVYSSKYEWIPLHGLTSAERKGCEIVYACLNWPEEVPMLYLSDTSPYNLNIYPLIIAIKQKSASYINRNELDQAPAKGSIEEFGSPLFWALNIVLMTIEFGLDKNGDVIHQPQYDDR